MAAPLALERGREQPMAPFLLLSCDLFVPALFSIEYVILGREPDLGLDPEL